MHPRYVAILRFILLVLCVGMGLVEMSSAQPIRQMIRQQIRQALDIPPPGTPGHQVGQQAEAMQEQLAREPLVQGDGRFLERAQKIIGIVANGGPSDEPQLKPIATISLASFEEFKRVTQLVAQEIRLSEGSAEPPEMLNAFLDVYGRIVGRGFDTNQPLGLVFQTDGVLYYPLLFTPLDWNSEFAQNLRKNYATQLPDGRFVIRPEAFNWPLGRLYVQEHNGWLFVATETQLAALPDDPTVLLQGLDKKHLMAARFDLQNLPSLTTRAALSLSEMQAVNQAETELEKATARLGIGYIRSLAEQADFLEYTVTYDEEYHEYVVQQTEIVKPNTERAKMLQQRRDAVSPFHGFYHPEGAMFASHLNMTLSKALSDQLEIILDETLGKRLLTEEERDYLKQKTQEEPKRNRRQREVGLPQTVSPQEDASEHLARLLTQTPTEMADETGAEPEIATEMPEIFLSVSPETEQDEKKNFENVLRKIYACYYWALIGAIRSGNFDGASTCSQEYGLLAGYNIVEGEKFQTAIEAVLTEYEKQFPAHFGKNVRKNYAEAEGFRLTSISLRLRDFLETSPLGKLAAPALGNQETRIVFALRKDAVCFAVGPAFLNPEGKLLDALATMNEPQPVQDLFFVFSPYEVGQAIALSGELSGDPNRPFLSRLKQIAASGHPQAIAFATTEFTDTTKTIK